MLYHFPSLPLENLQPKFNSFPWCNDEHLLDKWKIGETGYPIIDAGMKELYSTGYMHNRVRMIVASFLVKNLLIHWHKGEKYFWNCLFDADLAKEILDRSKNFIKEKEQENQKLIEENINDENLKNLEGINNEILAELAKSKILTLDDFADLATFELIDKDEGILRSLDIEEELANNMIMEARKNWFD